MILRLDEALVARKHYATRSRARDAVERGCVRISGKPAAKPSQTVQSTDELVVDDPAQRYVSRAALKLVHALDHFALSPAEQFCLDVGASTGGFTQVLLERSARHVVAVDVGHDQLEASLRDDPRVTSLEGVNARDLATIRLAEAPTFLVSDVSFISLRLALPASLARAHAKASLIALIKPQFEVGRERLPKDGVVKDPQLHEAVQADIKSFLEESGWKVLGLAPSPLTGGDGNQEFLIAAKKK